MTEHDEFDLPRDDIRTRETEPPSAPEGENPDSRSALEKILGVGRATVPLEAEAPADDGLRDPEYFQRELNVPAWLHAMARQLHGWHEHAHHEGKPYRLSREAYLDALNAANETEPKRQGKPSLNAVSPHRGKGL